MGLRHSAFARQSRTLNRTPKRKEAADPQPNRRLPKSPETSPPDGSDPKTGLSVEEEMLRIGQRLNIVQSWS